MERNDVRDLRAAVDRCIAAWAAADARDRQEPLADLGMRLEALARSSLDDKELVAGIDGFALRRGGVEDTATLHVVGALWMLLPSGDDRGGGRQLPVEAWLSTAPGAISCLRVGGRDAIFEALVSERHLERLLAGPWAHKIALRLA